MTNNSQHILFFDGVCGLCNKAVDFSMRHQKSTDLVYAPLQGETAKKLLPSHYYQVMDSLVLYTPTGVYTESDAALRLAALYKRPWSWLRFLRLVPSFMRNSVYRWVAKNRYRIFGKKESCRLPSSSEKELFLP